MEPQEFRFQLLQILSFHVFSLIYFIDIENRISTFIRVLTSHLGHLRPEATLFSLKG